MAKLRVGAIGVGGMGRGHLLSIQAHNNIGNKHNIRPGRVRVVLAQTER